MLNFKYTVLNFKYSKFKDFTNFYWQVLNFKYTFYLLIYLYLISSMIFVAKIFYYNSYLLYSKIPDFFIRNREKVYTNLEKVYTKQGKSIHWYLLSKTDFYQAIRN